MLMSPHKYARKNWFGITHRYHSFLNFFQKFSLFVLFFEEKMEEEGYSNDWFLDDINSSLNTILAMIKTDTQQLPQLELLGQIRQCLECLACSSPEEMASQRARFVSLSWPADLRVVLQRLFRTFGIPEEYVRLSYEMSNFASQCLGNDWLRSDLKFLKLLASLSSGRLRVILDEPDKVDIDQLIACLHLQEFFIGCVEDDADWLGDDDATFLSKNCQEACTFICEYVIECDKQSIDASKNANLFLALSHYFYEFLKIGGAQILEKNLLEKVTPLFDKISKIDNTESEEMEQFPVKST
uniref:Uncharacterized protein n=1 Tax=Meloidogyne enterolobii TaxID=390850 RepID=A0A6V7VDJ2_MELEN|nr:unnamed protein product [Meloidogyne enterolobii]